MVVFAKIRQAFTAVVGEVTHEAGVIIAVTEDEFKAIAHKVEVLAQDVAQELHLTKGHALALSPAVTALPDASLGLNAPLVPDAPATAQLVNEPSADAAVPAGGSAPTPAETQEAAEPVSAASKGEQSVAGGAAA